MKKQSTLQFTMPLPSEANDAHALIGFGNNDPHENLDWVAFKQVPVSEKYILKLGKELVEWAMKDEQATKIRKFFRTRGIDYHTIGRWRKRVPEFDRYYRFALDAIGDRREDAAYNKDFQAIYS